MKEKHENTVRKEIEAKQLIREFSQQKKKRDGTEQEKYQLTPEDFDKCVGVKNNKLLFEELKQAQ